MPKWISIDEAAHKYGVKEEDICLWAEMEAITASFTETTLIIDEKSLQYKKHRISVLERQYAMATKQNKLREKIITITSDMLSKAESGWWEKLWMKISNRQKL